MRHIRPSLGLLAAVMLACLPATAFAHAELVATQPAANAMLDTPLSEVTVTFDSELDPDASSLEITDADGSPVGDGGVDLNVADRNVLAASVDIAADGTYDVAWTAGSIDGHVETGTFSFRVGTPVANTALPAPASGLVAIGFLLTALGGAMLARRLWSPIR